MTQTRIAEVKHQLGRLYLDSQPRNYKKAIPLFEEAGEEGNSDAWDDLGSIYYNPMKDPNNIYENIEKAITYFQKAVENGNVNATFNFRPPEVDSFFFIKKQRKIAYKRST